MKVAIASDFSGFRLKEAVKAHIIGLGYDVADVGQQKEDDKVMYFEAASAAAKALQSGAAERAIVFCGSGGGVSLIANKFKGVYCVLCESVFTAERSQWINNANVLAMGENIVAPNMAKEAAEKWLASSWCAGMEPARRANNEKGFAAMQAVETENMK